MDGVAYDGYAIDKQAVFWRGGKLTGADVSTFELIPNGNYYLQGYAKDKENVYFNGCKIPRDVSTFKLLSYGYSIDKNGIYYFDGIDHRTLAGADVNSYRLEKDYLFSNNTVYLFGERVDSWDAASFEVVISSEATGCDRYHFYALTIDKNGVYYNQVKIGPHMDSADAMYEYWKDNKLNEVSEKWGIKNYSQHPRTIRAIETKK